MTITITAMKTFVYVFSGLKSIAVKSLILIAVAINAIAMSYLTNL